MARLVTFLVGLAIEASVWVYIIFGVTRRPYCLDEVGGAAGRVPCTIPQAVWDSYNSFVWTLGALVLLGVGLMLAAVVAPHVKRAARGRRATG